MGEGERSVILSSGPSVIVSLCLCTVGFTRVSQFFLSLEVDQSGRSGLELGIPLL